MTLVPRRVLFVTVVLVSPDSYRQCRILPEPRTVSVNYESVVVARPELAESENESVAVG